MTRPAAFLWCVTTLLLGIVIGGRYDRDFLAAHANANALDQVTANRLFDELNVSQSSLHEGSALLAKIARLTTGSVVHIQSERRTQRRGLVEETGSGVIVESDKAKGMFVVTNRHVVEGANLKDISIHLHDGRVITPLQVLSDKATDVAVMKISAANLQPARWGNSDKLDIGHMVLAMGSPFGLSQSITYGIISAKGRRALRLDEGSDVLNQDFLQTDAAINPGNSGGPLINLQGQIVGINTAIASNSGGNEGIGFSIPSNLVVNVIEQLLTNGKVTRAYLGVKLDPAFDTNTASRLKLDRPRGARVLEIYPNTPASRANLKFDDVVLTFDGVEVQDENHLINLVSLSPLNEKVKVVLYRDGKYITVEIAVGDRAELEERAEAPPSEPGMGTRVQKLGLTLHRIEPEIAAQLGFDKTARGLLVLNVEQDGPLARDVQLYDLISEVGRTPVASVEDLLGVLSTSGSDAMLLKIRRNRDGLLQDHAVVLQR